MNKIAISLLIVFAAIITACNKDDWKPGPKVDVPGIYFDVARSQTSAMLGPDDKFIVIVLGRDGNKSASALDVPITIVSADEGLSIPSKVTFVAGSAFAELKIEVTDEDWDEKSYSLEIDSKNYGPYTQGVTTISGEIFFDQGPVTPENIAKYKQPGDVLAHELFLNEGSAAYRITLMSQRLEDLFTEYREFWPFSHIVLQIPRSSTSFVCFTWHYTTGSDGNNPAVWYHENLVSQSQGITPMAGDGSNANSDVTFTIPTFTSRSNLAFSASGFASAAGGALVTSFRNFLQAPTGFTIIVDRDNQGTFWIRSKEDPTDWFVCVRQ